MLGAGVHLELLDLLTAERALRQHAAHAEADRVGRLAVEQVLVRLALQTARVAGVAVHLLLVGLALGHDDLVGVDDDHVVARVDVRGEHGLVLAAQHASDLGAETAEDHALGVDDVPSALDLTGLRAVRTHLESFDNRLHQARRRRGTVQ
jgi:hypothetical protein